MAVTALGRVFVVTLLCIAVRVDDTYSIPEVEAKAFTPKGFRVTRPDAPSIAHFTVQGLLKRDGESAMIDISGGTASKVHIDDKDFWVVDLPDLELKLNDQIEYLTFVAANSTGCTKDDLKSKVKNFHRGSSCNCHASCSCSSQRAAADVFTPKK